MATETVKVIGLQGVLQTLHDLGPEVVSKRGGPVRSALRKASLDFKKAMQGNIQRIIDDPNIAAGGRVIPTKSLGLLKDNIITQRRKMPGLNGERYKVGPRLRKAYPKSRAGNKPVSVVQVGRQLETGTEHRRPYPWARPAFDSKKHQVVQIFVYELTTKLPKIQRKLAAKNGVS